MPCPKHGIFRDLVERERFDGTHDRRYPITIVSVTADGAGARVKTLHAGSYLRLQIGDPDRTITGVHTYVIKYSVRGALLSFPDHDELYWDAIGNQWPVPIDRATVLVTAPVEITRYACFTGPPGSSLPCESAVPTDTGVEFTATNLGPGEGLTVVVAIPKGVVQPAPAPIIEERKTLATAFKVTPVTAGVGGAIALLAIAAVGTLAWRRGRDRQFSGSAVDAAFGNTTGAEAPMPLGARDSGPVEFVPPDQVRPGQVGTLVDEHANLLDVTATIIDLAVRGFLKIVDLPAEGLVFKKHDYELQRLDGGKGALLPYEQKILDAVFATGPTVKLSDLKYKFRAELSEIQSAMYDDSVAQGWYRIRPDRTRITWALIAGAIVVVGVAITALVAFTSSFGLIPVGIVLAGIVLFVLAGKMPARTGKGSAMLSRIGGFRRLFDEGEEDTRARFAEQHGIFAQYLPYAIVFGCADKWAHAFEGLDAEQLGTTGWYGGSGNNILGAMLIAQSMDDFGTTAVGTLYASQPSSSSSSGFSGGFSGGGGGGGGGGSW